MDVRVKRGADFGSDHHMVVATLRVKLRKTRGKKPQRQQFDEDELQYANVRSNFVPHRTNKFQALLDWAN